MRIGLRPPDTATRSSSPTTCHEWAASWATYDGPGHVEYANLRFPTGTHPMPRALVLERPRDVARVHPRDLDVWMRCGQRLTHLERVFPEARLKTHVRRVTQLAEADYDRLVRAVTWLRGNPTSGMLLRQLPIEGVDTKWLVKHTALVLALLGDQDTEQYPGELPLSRKRALHQRLGLRVVPELVQVSVLDPDLRVQFAGMKHFAATVEDLNRWPRTPDTVLILENKETAFALTQDHHRTVVLHGHGFHVDQYARISWVRSAERIVYWGDIDAPGLQFVSDLRSLGIGVRTILTSIETLERYRHLAVDGAMPQRTGTPPNLAPLETELYEHLAAHASANGIGLLLEQERIPWQEAYPVLKRALDDVVGAPATEVTD